MNIYAAIFIIPFTVVLYTSTGGLKVISLLRNCIGRHQQDAAMPLHLMLHSICCFNAVLFQRMPHWLADVLSLSANSRTSHAAAATLQACQRPLLT